MAVQQGAAPDSGRAAPRLLVIESDTQTAAMAHRCLTRAGFSVEVSTCVTQALAWVKRSRPDLVVLDPRLPGDDDFAFERLRACSDVPVVMISPRGDEHERTWGLMLGADDFVPNPVSPEELVARVHSVLRRSGRGPALVAVDTRGADPFRFDVVGRRVCVLGTWIALTALEFRLLAFLTGHPTQAFSREELLERVWGYTVGNLSTVTVHVRRLREKIEPDPAHPVFLVTVWGVGYRVDLSGGDAH
jgi:DNA-binding response OmpR family regulator